MITPDELRAIVGRDAVVQLEVEGFRLNNVDASPSPAAEDRAALLDLLRSMTGLLRYGIDADGTRCLTCNYHNGHKADCAVPLLDVLMELGGTDVPR